MHDCIMHEAQLAALPESQSAAAGKHFEEGRDTVTFQRKTSRKLSPHNRRNIDVASI